MSDVKKQCQTCQHRQIGELRSSIGVIDVASCRQPIGERFRQIVGPTETCDKWAMARRGVS